jgi:urease accessory protein
MGLAALVLADARFPGGGHVHSGGVEEAVARGLVHDVSSLGGFLEGRLRTAGLVAAAFAAEATHTSAHLCTESTGATPVSARTPALSAKGRADTLPFPVLDAELDARTPSAAQREASRAQGRGSLRAARAAWPSPLYDELGPRPHHPILMGAVCGIAGEPPEEAARCVAYLAISGPASAAVRLLGLDPFAVNAALVRLGPALAAVVRTATTEHLPAPSAPVLDLMAQAHVEHHGRMRLFAS